MSKRLLFVVDPGSVTGVAVFSNGDLKYADSVKVGISTDHRMRSYAIRRYTRFCGVDLPMVEEDTELAFVSEDQYLSSLGPQMFKTVSKVIANAASWETVASAMGFSVLPRVHPQKWQAHWGLKGKRAARKDKSLKTARKIYPNLNIRTNDQSDAVLMGLYWLTQNNQASDSTKLMMLGLA